jgi:hypothetical protein
MGTRMIDHKTPLSRGGHHDTSNLAIACAECNLRKTTDGFIPAVPDAAALTDIIPDTSAAFWTIVATIGWLSFRNGGVQIPNFDHWLGSSGKKRLKEARKKRKQRANVPILSPVLSPTERTTSPVLFSPPPEGKTSSGIEEGSGEKKGADCARDGPPTADGWPGYLAGEWLKHFTGTQVSERDPDKLKRFFGGLIAEGIQPTDIRDRIRDTAITALPDRRRPGRECTWDFAKRFGVKANGYQRPPRRESLRYDPARDG